MQFLFGNKKKISERIHLDYASATPVRHEILAMMQPYFSVSWANPSAIYAEGVHAREVIESHRTELARVLNVRPSDVTFTSGGTEANNLALIGFIEALRQRGKSYVDMEILSTRIEHPSIMKTLSYLENLGVTVSYVSVDSEGLLDMNDFVARLNQKVVLCTFAYVNSEIGVVQDVKKITRLVRKWNAEHDTHVYTHTDASQAPLWLPCTLDMLGVDMLTLDAGKCYGPKGVGVLVHREWVPITATLNGGGQEGGLRSGTENTALIVGCVRALVRAQEGWKSRSATAVALRDRLFTLLQEAIPNSVVNGSRASRVANNVNISIPGLDTEYAVIWLDARGIAVSTRSACGAQGSAGSHVVREMTHDEARATSTLRFTLGEETTESDIVRAVKEIEHYVVLMSTDEKLANQ